MNYFTCEWCGSAIRHEQSAEAETISCSNCGGPIRMLSAAPPALGPAAGDRGFFDFLHEPTPGQMSSRRQHSQQSRIGGDRIATTGSAPIDVHAAIFILVGIAILIAFSVEAGRAFARNSNDGPPDDSLRGLIAAIDCLLIGSGATLIWGLRLACPKCRGLFARRVVATKNLGTEHGTATVVRTDRHYAGYSLIDRLATTVRQEQVSVVRSRHRNRCRCRWCGQKWSFVSVAETQGL